MRILLFAQIKDGVGLAGMELTLSQPLDAGALWQQLIAAQPALAHFRRGTRLARNGEYATAETLFADTDEVALIPAVSGG
jgi:molybdopterin converting factor small subunit